VRLLLDSCLPQSLALALKRLGHDISRVADWPDDPGDEAILVAADRERRVLITLDRDFGELAVLGGLHHCGIVRLVRARPSQYASICAAVLVEHAEALERGAVATVSPGRVRIRLPE
jgi:predicted nuclease of predicted toxin-antitoxin system